MTFDPSNLSGPGLSGNGKGFPNLPIIPASEVRKTQAEKYGGLFYLGAVGLALLIGLIAWFGWGVWSLRYVWSNIYVLNDPSRDEATRLAAAKDLVANPDLTPQQRLDLSLSTTAPIAARILIAESIPREAILSDPKAFPRSIAEKEGLPAELRLVYLRQMAFAADWLEKYPEAPLRKLIKDSKGSAVAWGQFCLSATRKPVDPEGLAKQANDAETPLLKLLIQAIQVHGAERVRLLNEAKALDDVSALGR